MIRVYTTPTCPWCHVLMDWLDQKGIEYEEIDASTMPDIQSVPVTEINGQRILGFAKGEIENALKEAGINGAANTKTT